MDAVFQGTENKGPMIMAGTNAEDYAVIETYSPQVFRFYPDFYITSTFFAVFFIGLVFVAWVPLIMVYCSEGIIDVPIVRAAGYCTATFLFLAALGSLGKRELGKVRFVVSLEGIARSDPYRKISVAWGDVTGVRCRRIPFAKGHVEITTPRTRLLLPSTITHFDRLSEAVQKGLERAGKAALLDNAFLRTMVAMGKVSERWNSRAKSAFWPLVAATIGIVLFNSFVTSCVWETGTVALIIWAGVGLPLPLLVYSIADIRLNRCYENVLLRGDGTAFVENIAGELLFGLLVVAPFYGILGIIARGVFFR